MQVSEEMIEAGCDARFATIHESGVVAVEAIYLAMKAAEPLPQGDERARQFAEVAMGNAAVIGQMEIEQAEIHNLLTAAGVPLDDHSDEDGRDLTLKERVECVIHYWREEAAAITAIGQSIEGEDDWVHLPQPIEADFTEVGEAVEAAMLSEKSWPEIGEIAWRILARDREITDWTGAKRGKFSLAKDEERHG